MNPKIRRLSDEVVRHIAAGEVVERPASVLKELLENSLDAGAGKIQVETRGAGRLILRVVDDGCGMAPEDCRLALERHATSKIAEFSDLERLSTFGFRGEALASIAAVAKVTLTGSPAGSKRGWCVNVEGGKLRGEHEAPPTPGTTVEVAELFYNTPARAKFLKSDATERSQLLRVIEEAALAHPGVTFIYKSDSRTSIRWEARSKPAAGASNNADIEAEAYRSRASEVLGHELGQELLAVSENNPSVRLRAFLAAPDRLVAARSLQYFFVNKRPVTSRILSQALYRAYEPFRTRERHPAAVVFLELPPDSFDVNVHPAKREVRFRSERVLFEAVAGACSAALLRAKGIPSLAASATTLRAAIPGAIARGISKAVQDYPIPQPVSAAAGTASLAREPGNVYAAQSSLELAGSSPARAVAALPGWPRWFTPPFRFLGQIEASYLVFEAAGGILVVDQHAAQERILFERYLAELEKGKVRSQKLMLPLPVELPASQVHRVLARAKQLEEAGFSVEPFGKTTLHVTEAPALFGQEADIKEMVHRLLETLQSEYAAAAGAIHHAAATIACKAAVKAHDRLGAPEALRLLEELKDLKDGTSCPHGRPSMISLNRDELARRFKRPGAPPL